MELLGLLWDQGIMRPMINALALLYHYLFLNYGLSIIAFTVVVRVLMIPLTIRQTRQMKKLQTLQPRMKAIQDKYKDKKDPESRRAQSSESMALYREAGSKSNRVSGTDDHPDADLDRFLPCHHPDDAHHTRGNGEPFSIFLCLEPRKRRRSIEPPVLRHRPRRHGISGLPAS